MEVVAAAPPPQNVNPLPQWGGARVRLHYDTYLTALSLRDGEKSYLIITGKVLLTLHRAVIFRNWHLCGAYWEDCKRKHSHVLPPIASDTR